MTTPTADSRSTLIHAALDRPGDDPIFSLNAEALRRSRAGEDILNATLGALMEDDGRLAILPSVSEALRAVPPEAAAAYAPIAGPPRFLAAVVRDLFGEGPLAASSVAVATPGGTGALHHAIVNFLEPGQALLTTSYHWAPYQILAAHTGRRVETFRMFDGEGRIDLAALERALRRQVQVQGRALLVLNTPCHNPTGYALDAREWREVLELASEIARSAPLAVAVDHAYAKFGRPGVEPWAQEEGALAGDAVLLVAWTVSKSFAQYGARVGALVACHPDEAERRRIQNALSFSCRGTWSNCNHHGMLAITELLSDPELRARSDRERERLRRLLDERVSAFNLHAARAGLRYPRYEGGFFVAVFTPDAERTASRMRELGVFVVPLSGAVRVALCSTPARDVPRLVEALRQGLGAASG
ncbi:MAG TPA: aminotransferase class I/II-fold pyridoxal phosphate-dependent enzyme [Planctomycetota bacterium]|nr:aminotransferase class I/II-fold pyridoxal phosphate-dependent enzyme [Planctomycetota bacterium]